MAKTYSSAPVSLKPTNLDGATLLNIGRLVRAFAEIEDLITMYICHLAEINESRGLVLLGKTNISKKLEIAEYLAKMTGKKITSLHGQLFNEGFRDAKNCRNAVAHGVLMGVSEDGRLAFLTSTASDPVEMSAMQEVISYEPKDIKIHAELAERAIPLLEEHLKLGPWRKRRLERPLLPHRKFRIQPEKK